MLEVFNTYIYIILYYFLKIFFYIFFKFFQVFSGFFKLSKFLIFLYQLEINLSFFKFKQVFSSFSYMLLINTIFLHEGDEFLTIPWKYKFSIFSKNLGENILIFFLIFFGYVFFFFKIRFYQIFKNGKNDIKMKLKK